MATRQARPFRGHYEVFIPAGYARCLWQADAERLQSRLMAVVKSEDGENRAATVAIASRNFTSSSPTITVKPKKHRR